jgi:hypothetical protein
MKKIFGAAGCVGKGILFLVTLLIFTQGQMFGQQKISNYIVSERKVKYRKDIKRYIAISYSVDDNSFNTLNVDSLVLSDQKGLLIFISNSELLSETKFSIVTKVIKNNRPQFITGKQILLSAYANKSYFELPVSNEVHLLLNPLKKNCSVVSISL